MTRQEAIERWKNIASTVFWAEEAISKEWNERLHAAPAMTHEEQQRPLIAVVSSYNEIVPGHMNLDKIVDAVKLGVAMAGGTPIVFPAIAVCDGIAMGHEGMKYSLVTRDLIADSTESMLRAHGFDGVVINITNPCDVVTYELAKGLGLPKGRVFGTGTGLDTSRLLSALARQTGIDHKSITAYMLGEHGNQQFAAWSNVSFQGKPLDEWAKTDERFRFDRAALQKESIGGGWVTFSGKFCTEYGIATTAARMVSIVLHDEKQIMPASAELCGEYGETDVFVGVPAVIGKDGVEQVVEIPLNDAEKAEFRKSCDVIRGNIRFMAENK